MFPTIQIGPLAIQTSGLILLAGLWLGLSLSEKNAQNFGLKRESLDNLVLITMIGGILGARLGYVIQYPSIFFENPISILSLNPGLLDPWTGFVVALMVAFVFGQRTNLEFWTTLDALTPGFSVAAVAIGFSHLASGAAFGMPTDVPWAISLWGANRHPSQVYEIMAASLILILLWPEKGYLYKKISKVPGLYFLSFCVMTAIVRLFLEAFRGDSVLILNGLRQAQVIAWLILAAVLVTINYRRVSQTLPTDVATTDIPD